MNIDYKFIEHGSLRNLGDCTLIMRGMLNWHTSLLIFMTDDGGVYSYTRGLIWPFNEDINTGGSNPFVMMAELMKNEGKHDNYMFPWACYVCDDANFTPDSALSKYQEEQIAKYYGITLTPDATTETDKTRIKLDKIISMLEIVTGKLK
jgi:hypothetical protein